MLHAYCSTAAWQAASDWPKGLATRS
jgi:hypothetical protein